MADDCTHNTGRHSPAREGTNQAQRFAPALNPSYAPADERTLADRLVFARAYSEFLQYYDATNTVAGNWQPFFAQDVAVQLALAAVQDVSYYQTQVKKSFDFLKDKDNQANEANLKKHLGYLFSYAGTLARQLDAVKEHLPPESALKNTLRNLIQHQLAPVFQRLTAYYKADTELPLPHPLIASEAPKLVLFGKPAAAFGEIDSGGLSQDWGVRLPADGAVYGSGAKVFERVNRIATHNLFTAIFDQFLKIFARVVSEAKRELAKSLAQDDSHEPHFALFLAFLRLFEYARDEANTLTQRHLDFYYREVLRLQEKPATPQQAHLLVELAKQASTHALTAGTLFKAGKDKQGTEAFFANARELVANQAQVTARTTIYRHNARELSDLNQGRIYAAPVANSDDGLGAELTSEDKSWHPFFHKIYRDGALQEIKMPFAEVGFAIASHYLWLAEGGRKIIVDFGPAAFAANVGVTCLLTTAKGWLQKDNVLFQLVVGNRLQLQIDLTGADPAITPYTAKTHGYNFATNLPVLLVKLPHDETRQYAYPAVQDIAITQVTLAVQVNGLKTLALSNDFGPVDASKPFQPFGPAPVAGNAFIVGSKELFHKELTALSLNLQWLQTPQKYVPLTAPSANIPVVQVTEIMAQARTREPSEVAAQIDRAGLRLDPQQFAPSGGSAAPNVSLEFLAAGQWQPPNLQNQPLTTNPLTANLSQKLPLPDEIDLAANELYRTDSRQGFLRLRLEEDFGQTAYQTDLLDAIQSLAQQPPPATPKALPVAPVIPSLSSFAMSYTATQTIPLDTADAAQYANRAAQFIHVAPFGQAEQHPYLKAASEKIYLFPQFKHDSKDSVGEFYIGVTGLQPPQNLTLLFQVTDGTANPLAEKPKPHIRWSYLRGNEWRDFAANDVEDQTGELLNSGIITFAVPRDATADNTLLPAGQHWLRATVSAHSDAVCRLQLVAAQALRATFQNRGNDPAFPSQVLPAETISKLDEPVAAVKKIVQPFPTFGGRGAEQPQEFYTRASERLRHKDRAVTLWDYERLILEAFPQIYQAKCLNHTRYEPDASIYRELAPGHVTVVTIPNRQFRNPDNPLRPFTSLGLLQEIEAFLRRRLSCFGTLHVKNPLFEEVAVNFKVRFYDGFDEKFYIRRLQESITRFLSPWAFAGEGSPTFGGKIYKSVLVNFVEEQPFVDYVTDFQLFRGINEQNEVAGSSAVSVLVSAPAGQHQIEVIKPTGV